MKLFAQQGFAGTSVGEIEAAAGLQPRRGGLYKHFSSKEALLEEAIRGHLGDAASVASGIQDLDYARLASGDPERARPLVEDLGRWFLREFDRMEELTRLIEHEGTRLSGLVRQIKTEVVDLSYQTAAALISVVAPESHDPEAEAVVLLGALVGVRRTAWTFGSPPLGADDDRVIHAWAELALSVLAPDRARG